MADYSLVPVDHDPFAGLSQEQVNKIPDSPYPYKGSTPASDPYKTWLTDISQQDPKYNYGDVLPIAQNKETGSLTPAVPNFLRDVAGGVSDLVMGTQTGEVTPRATQLMASQAILGGLTAKPEANTLYTFLGQNARNADKEALARAQSMEDKGLSAETTRKSTGWFRGIDDQWRFEHSDLAGKVTGRKYLEAAVNNLYNNKPPATIGDIYHDPVLYKNYPELAKYPIEELPPELMNNASAAYSAPEKKFYVSRETMESPDLKSRLLHEIQHAIQHREGFAGGGNTSEFLPADYHVREQHAESQYFDFINTAHEHKISAHDAHDMLDDVLTGKKEPDDFHYELAPKLENIRATAENLFNDYETAQVKYHKLAGEAESRLVEQRSTLSPSQINTISPFPMHSLSGNVVNKAYSFDVPPAEQTVRFKAPYEEKAPAPGIDYLEGKPSSNYVINSPHLIDAVKKYGVGVLHSSGFPLGTYLVPVEHTPDFGSLR